MFNRLPTNGVALCHIGKDELERTAITVALGVTKYLFFWTEGLF